MKGLSCFLFAACLAALPLPVLSPSASSDEGSDSVPAVIRSGGMGVIQRLRGEAAVIDDRSYTVSSSARYHTAAGESTWREGFGAGDRVLFELGSEGEIVLLRKVE